jgi:hypothetical protein
MMNSCIKSLPRILLLQLLQMADRKSTISSMITSEFDGDHIILLIWMSQRKGQSSSRQMSISHFASFKAAEVAEFE